MNSVMCGLNGEQVAIEFGVSRHCIIIDIVAECLGDGGGFLRHLLHIIGKALILAKVSIFERAARLVQIAAKVVDQFRAKSAVLCDERGQLGHALEAVVFVDADRGEALIIVDCPLLGVGDG